MSTPVAIELTARLDQYLSQLGKVKDLTAKEVKGLQAQLSRDLKSAENAAKQLSEQQKKLQKTNEDLARSSGDLTKSVAGTGDGATKALKAFGPLGGVLSRLDPTAGQLSSTIAGLTSAFEGFEAGGAGLLEFAPPLGAALGILAGVYVSTTGVIDDYAEAERAATAAEKAHKEALKPLGDAIAEARRERDLYLEALNSSAPADALKVAERQIAISAKEAEATAELRKEREDLLRVVTEGTSEYTEVIADQGATVEMTGKKLNQDAILARERIKVIDKEIAAVHGQGAELNALQGQLEEIKLVAGSYTGELVKQKTATDEVTEAERKLMEQSAAMQAGNDDAAAALGRYEAGLESLRDTEDKALGHSTTALAQIEAERIAARQAAAETAAKAVEGAGLTAAAEEEIHRQLRATEAAIDAEAAKKTTELANKTAKDQIEAAKKVAEEEQRIYEARLSATSDLFGAMNSAFGSLSQNLTEDQKDAQMALFIAQQLSAAAQAAVNTELAASQAAASAPPPYNAIPIAAAYATGLATELAIATTPPPSFTDTPTVMRNQGSGPVTVAGGDYYAAARNPEDLRRQVNGSDPMADYRDGGGSYAIVGARAYGRRITDDVAQRTPLAAILADRRDRPLGRRA